MLKLRSRRLCKSSSSKHGKGAGNNGGGGGDRGLIGGGDIQWELRPGGMLVQKREGGSTTEGLIKVKVKTGSQLHDISIGATSTFGEMKVVLAMVTGLEPREQRVLFRGKEREDYEHLHMVGLKDMDKVLLLEDPAIKERKLHELARDQAMQSTLHTISV
ncbi:BAG family molecular chaperone regulator 2 [Acorus calamus]|uniref:BAG family molecular chaperone regulator 2 n=1 Tax=Acorus calamus TaxID=4465 RepID=A0AAV9CPW3_ACOCL|nr:BAG family molecular chaperone regulator 2 [Acorus calamus]